MRNNFLLAIFSVLSLNLDGQNCNAFKYYGDTLQYEACIIAEEAKNHHQFSKKYQEIYDMAIEKCPYFADAYQARSVAYLKSGDFLTWKKLIDKAVEFKPKDWLGYRGWCRYQFFKDYDGAIKDIEKLDSLINYDLGHSANGDYHLNIAKAICYKAKGESLRAIEIIKQQLADEKHNVGIYDYLHLGVLYLENKQFKDAILYLEMQEKKNDLAENRFYKALAYKELGQIEECRKNLELAQQLYVKNVRMDDPYCIPCDKIYLKQIEDEVKAVANKG